MTSTIDKCPCLSVPCRLDLVEITTAFSGSAAVGGSFDWSEEADNTGRRSWAAVLRRSASYIQCKNVLEIVLQKEAKESFIVSESDCAI